MIIQTTKSFDKQYAKLTVKNRQRLQERLAIFRANPFDTDVRNRPIKGKKYLGYRSIDVTGDVRALYTVKGDIVIIFGFIGTHSQLYGYS